MKPAACLAAAFSALMLTACGGSGAPETVPGDAAPQEAPADTASTEAAGCADGRSRMPGTGLCEAAVLDYLGFADGVPDLPIPDTGCDFVPGEARMGPEGYLIDLALSCEGVTSQANVGIGAHRAELTVDPSAIRAKWGDPAEVVDETTLPRAAIYTSLDGQTVEESILGRARLAAEEEEASFEGCEVLPLYEGSDAVVVSLPIDEMPMEGPPMFCGPLGVRDGSVQFWRALSGDYIIYAETGGDILQDIDFTTMTLLVPDGADGWKRAPRPR